MKTELVTLFLCGIQCLKLIGASDKANLARSKETTQSSDFNEKYTADLAVDGNYNDDFYGESCSCVEEVPPDSWWTVDLKDTFIVKKVTIYNRQYAQERLDNLHVDGFPIGDPYLCGDQMSVCGFNPGPSGDVVTINCPNNTIARYIRLRGGSHMTLCEVEVFGQALNESTCNKRKMNIRKGTKVKSLKINFGKALSPNDCMNLCHQYDKRCNIFNFNVIDGSCVIPRSPFREDHLIANKTWNLYYTC